MGTLLEPVILYIILFFSSSMVQTSSTVIPFSLSGSLLQILLFNLPALALIWYLFSRSRDYKKWGSLKPGLTDLYSFGFTFPALILVGFVIAIVAPHIPVIPSGPKIIPPSGLLPWVTLIFLSLTTGYLEESFFRVYLLSKRQEMGLGTIQAAAVSTLLFSICHIYEGPWGFLNAALSGTVLAFIFLRYRSLHGIALAHGLYNIAAYVFISFFPKAGF